jgi:glycosyltransferase involved in cell wall biosynthesis
MTIDLRMWFFSGMGKVLQNSVPQLVKNLSDIEFVLLGDKKFLETIKWPPNVIEIRQFNSKIYSIREQIEILKIIPKNNNLLWWPHWNIPLLYRGPLINTIYDAFHLRIPFGINSIFKNIYTKLIFWRIPKMALLTFTISEFSKKEILKLTNINEKNINIVYPAVDVEWFQNIQKKQLLDKPYIVYVGNVKPHKNLSTLVKAFSFNLDKIDHKLVIIGKKEGFIGGDNSIEKLAEKYSDRVFFTGWLDDKVVREYVANADMMIFPSLYEGFGIPPLEAMACGCPVIASDIEVIREVCGSSVYYFNPNDPEELSLKIIDLINNKNLRKKLILDGKKQSQKYNWDKSNHKIQRKMIGFIKDNFKKV